MNNANLKLDVITKLSVYALIIMAFYMASRAFWDIDLQRMEIVVLTTMMFGATAWLLSSILPTFMEIRKYSMGAAGVLAALGIFLLLLEVTLTHAGLVWVVGQGVADNLLVSDKALYVASGCLSTFNVFAKWAFLVVVQTARQVEATKAEEAAKETRREERATAKARRDAAAATEKPLTRRERRAAAKAAKETNVTKIAA